MTRHNSEIDENKALYSLWWGWTLSFGAVTAIAVGSMWLGRVSLPALAFTISLILFTIVRHNRRAMKPMCYALPFMATCITLITAILLLILDLWNTPRLFPHAPEIHTASNPSIPYIGTLVVYPVAFIVGVWGWIKGFKIPICVDCRIRYGSIAERGFIGMIFSQESPFQRRLLVLLSFLLSLDGWIYYSKSYINSDLNKIDIYVFVIVPIVIYIISVIYMGVRYLSLWYYYNRDLEGTALRRGRSTTLRYIIIADNEIYLHVPDDNSEIVIGDEKIDTPAKLTIPHTSSMNLPDARYYFLNMFDQIGNDRIEVRFMYESRNLTSSRNIFHYLVFADSHAAIDDSHINGRWFSIVNIKEMLDKRLCSDILAAEIVRLHTIAMAWKTYDREGRRLYLIKHYVPTFRVCDIKKWDVDYNDSHWLYVAHNNEDKPFFRLRRFWHRYISGIKN